MEEQSLPGMPWWEDERQTDAEAGVNLQELLIQPLTVRGLFFTLEIRSPSWAVLRITPRVTI